MRHVYRRALAEALNTIVLSIYIPHVTACRVAERMRSLFFAQQRRVARLARCIVRNFLFSESWLESTVYHQFATSDACCFISDELGISFDSE
jgi:hypothetical protein